MAGPGEGGPVNDPLAALAREGEVLEFAGGADAESARPAPALDPDEIAAREWSGLPYLLGSLLGRILPEVRAAYSESACMAWGRAMVPVAKRYGWRPDFLGPWAALAAASVPLILPVYDAIEKRARAARAVAAAAPDAAVGAGDAPAQA